MLLVADLNTLFIYFHTDRGCLVLTHFMMFNLNCWLLRMRSFGREALGKGQWKSIVGLQWFVWFSFYHCTQKKREEALTERELAFAFSFTPVIWYISKNIFFHQYFFPQYLCRKPNCAGCEVLQNTFICYIYCVNMYCFKLCTVLCIIFVYILNMHIFVYVYIF